MKKIYNYIMLFMLALVAVCCSEEDLVTPANPAKSGDEVQFGLSLENLSRTIYGNETSVTTNNVTTNYFPIYWVNGDKVQIFSPQCLEGRRNAEYQVSVTGTEQDFADNLTKTGEIGVQWGNGETADFYSLYPSGNYTLSNDATKAENIFINYSQSIIVDGATVKSDMEDCLMYAKTIGVPRGEVVNLQYDPISTVFMITLNVPNESADDFIIQSVSLEAPAGVDIAGTFSLNISDGSFGAWGNNKANSVSAQIYDKATGGYYTLAIGKSVQIPLFIAPIKDQNNTENVLTIEGWKIKVVANQKEYVKTLPTQTIVPGKVHKVTLPNLSTTAVVEWDVSKWMTYIPRNVYLSEVSIPGSWNSINDDFQTMGTTDAATIENQYKQGVRAFHLDTRWKAEYSSILGYFIEVVGLGIADGGNGGNKYSRVITTGEKYMSDDDNPLVETIISQLVNYIKNTPEEYMVLVCSFAQESINHESSNGFWYDEISAICNKTDYANYIVDATTLTPNTLVGDVLGKILVIVNMQDAITTSTELPSDSKCMFTYMPSELTSTRFSESNAATLLSNNTDYLWYYKSGSITDESGATINTYADKTGISIYNNQAQITSSTGSAITDHDRGYAPSITERTNVLNTILNWSKSNYGTANYNHDKWIYLGLGGYQVSSGDNAGAVDNSYSTIASTYNTWINGKVTEMGTTPSGQTAVVPYYPVGIVLMNYVNNYASTVKNILLLNNKYRLQYDPNKPADYNPNKVAVTNYAASATNGGNAIVWE